MAIDPEVINPSSNEGDNARFYFPKWALYSLIGSTILIIVSIVKTFLPLIILVLLTGFIWKLANKD